MPSKKIVWSIAVPAALITTVIIWNVVQQNACDANEPTQEVTYFIPDDLPQPDAPPQSELFGDKSLERYGSGSPEDDLRLINHLLQNYRLLAKGLDSRHFSSNEAIGNTLRGNQSISLKAVSRDHRIFDSEGLLIDRWGTALFFHAVSASAVDVYSAGPDKTLGTEDDYFTESGRVKKGPARF